MEIEALGNSERAASVFVGFPLTDATDDTCITYGTPYHWLSEESTPDWKPFTDDCPVFAPSHDFFLAQNANGKKPDNTLLALYHKGVPAWSFYDNDVYGCLWRRNIMAAWYHKPGEEYATTVVPSDPTQTLAEYAIRIPDETILTPENGIPLVESLTYQKPVIAELVPENTGANGNAAGSFSLAEALSPAIITTAKPGIYDPSSLILRVYNPTNQPLDVHILLPGEAVVVNALEEELSPSSNDSLNRTADSMEPGENGFTKYTQYRSLTTLRVSSWTTQIP